MNNILKYLRKNGERLDTEIAKAVALSLTQARLSLAELTANGEVISCNTMRFMRGNKTEGISFRQAGFTPPASPGRKSKARL